MTDRISLGQTYSRAKTSIARNYQRLFIAQSQLVTGKRILRPSDGAADTGRLFGLIRQQENISRFRKTVETGIAQVDSAASSLLQLSEMVQRARELAVQGANGILSSGDRQAIGSELRELVEAIVAAANAQVEDRYAFGGTETGSPPYHLVTGADGLEHVLYTGNDEVQQVDIGPGVRAKLHIPGSRIFSSASVKATSFIGATGAVPGAGTDSGVGRGALLVGHLSTAFGSPAGPGGADPLTGLAPGSLSAGQDTILGSGYSLTIQSDGAGNGTISLNGGPSVAFTNTDTNLLVAGPGGEEILVDTTAITPSLPPSTVSITAQGTFSLDGGVTTVPIDFTNANQQVVNSETGDVLHVDATGVLLTGTEGVTYEGSHTLFDALLSIRDVLLDRTLDATTAGDLVRARLTDLDRAHDDVLTAMGELGARHSRFDAARNRLGDLDLTIADLRSNIEDADIAAVTLDISRFQTLYQASLIMASRISQISLLNFI